jgi:hypothetical protein
MPIGIFAEKELPFSYSIDKSNNTLATFATYGKYIYALRSVLEGDTALYYLDTIDSVTFEILSHSLITKGSTITSQNVSLPIKGAIISINLEGTKLVLAGGVLSNGHANTKIYSLNIKTAVVNVLFNNVAIGQDAPFYESPNDNAVYAFPQDTHEMVVIPYDSEDGEPVIIPYQENVSIKRILLRDAEDKLKVLGYSTDGDSLIFNIDLFNGEIDNYIETGLTGEVTVVLNSRDKILIYELLDAHYVNIYEYDRIKNCLSIISSHVKSILSNGHIKIDGLYERDDFIGFDTTNDGSYISPFYLLKMIHPEHEEIENRGFPTVLGNQVKDSEVYNKNAPLTLVGLHEYIQLGEYNIRHDKSFERLEVRTDPVIYIECDDLLWATEFHDGALLSVYYREETILYYINLKLGKIITSKKLNDVPLLHKRKTTEVAFVDNLKEVNGIFTTLGTVFVIGGESDSELFQDIQQIQILLREETNGQFTLTVYSSSIIPNDNIGSYKARVVKLSNNKIAVLFGITYEYQSPAAIMPNVSKVAIPLINKVENNKVHFITPATISTPYSITTRGVTLLNNPSALYEPKGIINEVFILSNHLYFVIGKYRYVAEITSSKELSDVLQFKEYNNGVLIPKEYYYIDSHNAYAKEINQDTNKIGRFDGASAINNLFQYNLNLIPITSIFDEFRKSVFVEDDNGVVREMEMEPYQIDVLGLQKPSMIQDEGYEFDVVFKKLYKDVEFKIPDGQGGYVVNHVDKMTIISEVPATPTHLALWREYSSSIYEKRHQAFNMAFTFQGNSNELLRDDYSYIKDSWQVLISNGEPEERSISIVLDDNREDIFAIYGDNPAFPLKENLLPIVLTYGELENVLTRYRYYLFIDIMGNIVTFDVKTKEFISIEGLEDVNIPYLSGELIILPSKVADKGSIGRRVWGFSENNPYSEDSLGDEVSVPDNELVS